MPDDIVGRLFLAVPLTPEVRRALAERLSSHGALPGRAVLPASWHLTLRFLGDTAHGQLERLREELQHAGLGTPFRIRFGDYGAFPRTSRATVLWLGVSEGVDPLRRLAQRVEETARRAGFPAEGRPFAPHLTLSRIRTPEDVRPLLEKLPPFPEEMPVSEVILYRSQLGAGPARYEPLDHFPLT